MGRDISRKVKKLVSAQEELEEELKLANEETVQLGENWSKVTEQNDQLQRANHYLREKISFLEGNINMTDLELAQVIYGDLTWAHFAETAKRGVLKVNVKGKWRKRHVALQDNFLFFFKPGEQVEPSNVMRLEEVAIVPGKRVKDADSYFTVMTPEARLRLCAASPVIMTQWMKSLTFCKPWYEEVPDKPFIGPIKERKKVSRAKSSASSVIQRARDTLRKYSTNEREGV